MTTPSSAPAQNSNLQTLLADLEPLDDGQREIVGRIIAGGLLNDCIRRRLSGRAQSLAALGLCTLERPRHPRTGRPYGGRRVITPTRQGQTAIGKFYAATRWNKTHGEVTA